MSLECGSGLVVRPWGDRSTWGWAQGRCETDTVSSVPRKEVIQPHLPVRLPCYDFVPIAGPALDGCPQHALVGRPASGVPDFHDVTGGVYKARERIHRGVLTRGY